jgi:hypothetical protein
MPKISILLIAAVAALGVVATAVGALTGQHGGTIWFPRQPFPRCEAERAGFEPATDLSARTRFPVALLRPLGHLSKRRQGIASGDGDLPVHPRSLVARDGAVEVVGPTFELDRDAAAAAG